IAVAPDAIAVNVGPLAVRRSDDVHPLSGLQLVLEITPDALAALRIEDVERDAITPAIASVLAVHAEGPLKLSAFALSQPMDVPRSVQPFGFVKGQRLWSDPGRYGQLAGCRHAEIWMGGNLDVRLRSVEGEIRIPICHYLLLAGQLWLVCLGGIVNFKK